MNKYFYLLIVVSFFNIGKEGCKDGIFDTKKYHKKTLKLQQEMTILDSLYQLTGNIDCIEPDSIDNLKKNYNNFCEKLSLYQIPDLITLDSCVVKDEKINLRKYSKKTRVWSALRDSMILLDSVLDQLVTETTQLNRFLEKDCLKKYNKCQAVKEWEWNKNMVTAIRDQARYRMLTDEELSADSSNIMKKLKEFEKYHDGQKISPMYEYLLIALRNDIKHRLSKKQQQKQQLCNDAHIRWAKIEKFLINEDNKYECEFEHLNDQSIRKAWKVIIDESWFKLMIEHSRDCAIHPRGCLCEEALNYNEKALIDNQTCIACGDSLALNYCPSTGKQEDYSCIYAICGDSCYAENNKDISILYPKYVSGRDSLIHDADLCLVNRCGCMNLCAENYDSTATIAAPDLCKGDRCGCLDSTAVNYARRKSPRWAYRKYYDESINKHDTTHCIYSGCMDINALNYDPLARTNDNSCKCDTISKQRLESVKLDSSLRLSGSPYSPEALKEEFEDYFNSLNKSGQIDFRRLGWDLLVDVEFEAMRIKPRGEMDGIPLGQYHFKPVNQTIDALISFLNFKTSDFLNTMLIVKIIGEADGTPIREGGIPFLNAGRPIHGGRYKKVNSSMPTDVISLSNDDYILAADSEPVNLSENNPIDSNIILAYLRAYMVAQKIRDIDHSIAESRMFIGAKTYKRKGKKYRRIAISMQLEGFYETVAKGHVESSVAISRMDETLAFYDKHGYPSDTTTYPYCPCISDLLHAIPCRSDTSSIENTSKDKTKNIESSPLNNQSQNE